MSDIRPVLHQFAEEMERILKKNDHKTHWRLLPVEALQRLLEIEYMEFQVAKDYLRVEDARHEILDLAVYCLILWDRLSVKE